MEAHYNVLFLCTGNSARSIMAEAILNHKGKPVFTAYSAGSHPSGTVHPEALKQLDWLAFPQTACAARAGMNSRGPALRNCTLSSRFATTPPRKRARVWPGQPMTAHWGVPDPAAVKGDSAEIERAFRDAFFILDWRISLVSCSSSDVVLIALR